MATSDKYYDMLFRDIAQREGLGATAPSAAAALPAKSAGKIEKMLGGAKKMAPGLIGWLLLDSVLSSRHQRKLQDIQLGGVQASAELMTPQNLYLQAALPKAQEEEAQARAALISQLGGGVLGPAGVKGERVIGG